MSWDSFLTPKVEEPTELGIELAPLVSSFTTDRTPPAIRTHLPALNDLVLGLYPGEVTVVGGRPGQGKSSFALDLFLANACHSLVYFFSLEMSKRVVLDRLLCNLADVSVHTMRQGALNGEAKRKLLSSMGTLAQYQGWIDDASSLSLRTLRNKLTTAVSRGAKLAIIDYFQIMTEPKTANVASDACFLSGGIRGIAKDLGVPILLLSQLNREVERRTWGENNEAPRPRAADLYGGGIEQAADNVWLVYRPSPQSTRAEILVAKNRNGPIGDIPCEWCPQYTSFRAPGDF
jgi:replicative DNA helicase